MAPKKNKAKTQKQLSVEQYTLLKKPLDHLGKQLNVEGSFWKGNMSAEERETVYKCTILDFSLAHKFSPDGVPRQAFHMQEMGVDGTGSLEKSNIESTKFWIEYPAPFLRFFYSTFPEDKETTQTNDAGVAGHGVDASEQQSEAVLPADVHPDFPNVRLGIAPVYKFWTLNSDALVEMGPKSGQFRAEFECIIEGSDGVPCASKRSMFHPRKRACSTTNLVKHIRDCAATCEAHKAALKEIDAANPNVVDLEDGTQVKVYNFAESFSHHLDMLWLRVRGLSHNLTTSDEFHNYVRGYDPRATFPHYTTMHRIAEAVDALQTEARQANIKRLTKQFKSKQCVGLQLDMWTDSETHTAFACVTLTSIEEPTRDAEDAELWLRSEILDFNVFPASAKTGAAIKNWFVDVCSSNGLLYDLVAGVTPDGAADGQCGLAQIEEIAEKVDTCVLHVLQRAVLFSLGIAGASTKNPAAKALLRKHNPVVALSRQSLAVGKAIRDAQLASDVPAHQLCTLTPTATTRWGNQFSQLAGNCLLRSAIDPAVDKFKRENRNNKEAIVEANESDQGSKVGRAVPAHELGLSSSDWEESQELEALLSYSYDIKETIEHRPFCTGAQGMMLLYDLKQNFCDSDANLMVKDFPVTLSLADREARNEKSRLRTREATDLCTAVTTAKEVMQDELNDRLFHGQDDRRPSNSRLILCYMSKQMPSSDYLPPSWNAHARTLYLQALRDAVPITRIPMRSSPPRAKKQKLAPSGGMLFRGAELKPSAPESPAPPPANEGTFDPVLDELKRWEGMGLKEYSHFMTADGLLNEFKMMWALRESFPLHFIVFKQTACHLPHEANVEQIFSQAGLLADPNLDPAYLAILVKVGFNKKAHTPSIAAVKEKYYEMFRGKKGADEDEAAWAAGTSAEGASA